MFPTAFTVGKTSSVQGKTEKPKQSLKTKDKSIQKNNSAYHCLTNPKFCFPRKPSECQ